MSTWSSTLPGVIPSDSDADRLDSLPWLFSPTLDVSIWLLPVVVTALVALLVARVGLGPFFTQSWAWAAQYVFGNANHVILSFLLLLWRREVAKTTPLQPYLLGWGSAAVWAVAAAAGAVGLLERAPRFSLVFDAAVFALAMHHTLSQCKGFWALYALRESERGGPPMPATERSLLHFHVPFALALILIRAVTVACAPGVDGIRPYLDIGQTESTGALPFWVVTVFLVPWTGYGIRLARTLAAGAPQRPKVLYLASHWTLVTIALVVPFWGLPALGAMHGLEYTLLSSRLLQPHGPRERAAFRGLGVGLVMLVAVSPVVVAGLATAPFLSIEKWINRLAPGPGLSWLIVAINATTLAHYFADALIFRFRVPAIRRAILDRLATALVPPG